MYKFILFKVWEGETVVMVSHLLTVWLTIIFHPQQLEHKEPTTQTQISYKY